MVAAPMRTRFDQFGKQMVRAALEIHGAVETDAEVPAEARRIDLWFTPDEARRMLVFIAQTARDQGLEDYNVIVNVGRGAGQTIFHLHWHVLGGRVSELPA